MIYMKDDMFNGKRFVEGNLFDEDDFEQCRQCVDTGKYDFADVLARLAKSDFRRRFRLNVANVDYVKEKGMALIGIHAADIIRKRLAPAVIPNDGKQTPMKGTSGVCCSACNGMLLPRLSFAVARHSGGPQAYGRGARVCRGFADDMD